MPWTLEYWSLNFDGSFTLQRAGARVVLTSPEGHSLKYAIHLDFRSTNNMTKYEGLLARLQAATILGIHHLLVKGTLS